MATGATLVLFGVLWIAIPFLVFGGPAMTKWDPAEFFLTPFPYFGLPFLLVGLLMILDSISQHRASD